MITPVRFLTKEEIERLNNRLRKLGYKNLVQHFIDSGWELESSIMLAKAMLKGLNKVTKDRRCCKNCRAGGYVLSLDKVSCSHTETYNDPDYVCSLHRKIGNKGVM